MLYGGLPAWKNAGYKTSSRETGESELSVKVLEGLVNSEDFIKAATSKSSDTVILDVRSYEEFERGIIPGAVTIPADEINDRIVELPPAKQIYIYCKSGVRAEMVYVILKEKEIAAKYLNKNVSVEKDGSFFIREKTRIQ
ncbi:MAG: rhodanese-like domain-containing protein [Desulforhopalus sp.]